MSLCPCKSIEFAISCIILHESVGQRLSDRDFVDILDKLHVDEHADKWRDIGCALGFSHGELNVIEATPGLHKNAPRSWLREMVAQWLQWAPGDGRGSTGFATTVSLHNALLRINLGRLADNFSEN